MGDGQRAVGTLEGRWRAGRARQKKVKNRGFQKKIGLKVIFLRKNLEVIKIVRIFASDLKQNFK
jgi:hypothetical protein